MLYAKKRIKSGPMLEDIYYPVLPSGRLLPGSIPKTTGTSEAQARYNARQTELRVARLVNANFDTDDIWMSLTYSDDSPNRPRSHKETLAEAQKYVRRVKRWRQKNGLPEMKYVILIHETVRRSGLYKGETFYHLHLFMTKMDRNAAERLWKNGEMVNANRFDPWRFGQESAARYSAKGANKKKKPDGDEEQTAREGRKTYVCSRNCKKPVIPKTQQRMGISRRRAEDMATGHKDDAAYWQAKVPDGYVYTGMDHVLNECNGKYYWRVTYRRLPEWNTKKKRKSEKGVGKE